MSKEKGMSFCTNCREETGYRAEKIPEKEIIKNREYTFVLTRYFCEKCGAEMAIPGSIDKNVRERAEQYRMQKKLSRLKS